MLQKITRKKTTIKLHNTLALPVLLYGSETWTSKAKNARRITAAEMKIHEKNSRIHLERFTEQIHKLQRI